MVVIVIISIVASLGANTYTNQRKQVIYNDSIAKVLSMIKQARNFAVTSRSYYDELNGLNIIPEEGYGVYIERSDNPGESRIILFANIQVASFEEKNQYDDGDDLIEEEYFLPLDSELVGLSIDKVLPITTGGGTSDDQAVIIFRPPLADATVAVNDDPQAGALAVLNDIYLEFRRVGTPLAVSSIYIHMNRIAGFPEIEKQQ